MLRPISAGPTTESQPSPFFIGSKLPSPHIPFGSASGGNEGSIAAICPSDSHKATKAQSDCALFSSLYGFVRTQESG
jgi:hypothetical protein